MQASYIFSATDVIANLGVIVAGLLVIWSGNAWPDWIVGLMIGSIVLIGAVRILRLR
jgi:Co/Zn/Cd efflux system component